MAGCENGDWRMDLSDNQLTKLPDEIGELKELEMLLVTGNSVTMEQMKKVVKIQKISSHAHKTVSVYSCTSKGLFSKFLTSTPVFFYMGVPLLPRPQTKTVLQGKRILS